MWWKFYFWLTVIELILQFLGIFVNPGIRIATQIAIMFIFAMAVAGMYSFAFQKKILNPLFWHYFTWIYALLDIVYLIYVLAPTVPGLSFLVFLQVYPHQTVGDVLFGVAVDIPLIYALYQLRKDDPFEKKIVKKKDEPFRWGMIQTAFWGYSIVLVFYLFILAFFPTGDATVQKGEVSDPYYAAGTFAPLLVFWLWVISQYKKYKWNWWCTTLALNGLLYSGIIMWGALFPTHDQAIQPSMGGIDIISLLQLTIMLVGLWVFGKTQFERAK